jgi:hypothetical protein
MSAQRNVRERVCALNTITGFKTAITAPASAVAAALICFGMVSAAQGAAETKLKEANTSIGVLPTNATNQWKLITDPVITTPDATPSDEVVFDPMNYYVVSGSLDNSYDASKFHLLTDSDGNYATGVTAEGVLPYQVTGFDVLMNGGGDIKVEVNPANPAVDIITPTGDVTDGEKGEVDDITFSLIGDLRSEAKTSNNDENFFDLVLVDNDGVTGPPTTGTVFAGPDSNIVLGPVDPTDPNNVTITDINPMSLSVPEPGSTALMLVSAGFMSLRRRKAAVQI